MFWRIAMQTITTIGLDITKSVFQVHGVDAAGEVVIRRQLKRRYVLAFFEKLPPCLVGIEACASSHYWSRELQVLGHTVRLMPPAYVKPYVKRPKNDAADAEAICEAVTRANMRFVPTKAPEQQSCLMLHRTRHLFIRQQTAVINSIRAHLAECGIVAPVGHDRRIEIGMLGMVNRLHHRHAQRKDDADSDRNVHIDVACAQHAKCRPEKRLPRIRRCRQRDQRRQPVKEIALFGNHVADISGPDRNRQHHHVHSRECRDSEAAKQKTRLLGLEGFRACGLEWVGFVAEFGEPVDKADGIERA
jgi:Transposase